MTTSQIKYIIEKMGYQLDTWTDLLKYPTIFLDQDCCVFTDYKTIRVKFNSTLKILEISYGLMKNNVFISNYGETEDYTPNYRISFDVIAGFSQTVALYLRNFLDNRK